jgi:hypothetical protein
MIMSRKRKWKSLKHKVEHLRLEIEDRNEVLQSTESDFLKALSELTDGSSVPNEEPPLAGPNVVTVGGDRQDHDVAPAPKGDPLPDDIKKIWKTIASLTHPDRTGNNPEKTKLYLAASRAVETGAVDEIIQIALELNIDIPEASDAAVAKLESLAKDLQKQLFETENSVLWQWGNAPPDIREKILNAYITAKKLKRKTPQV